MFGSLLLLVLVSATTDVMLGRDRGSSPRMSDTRQVIGNEVGNSRILLEVLLRHVMLKDFVDFKTIVNCVIAGSSLLNNV